MIAFGDAAWKEVVRVRPSSHRTGVLIRRGGDTRALFLLMHRGRTMFLLEGMLLLFLRQAGSLEGAVQDLPLIFAM